MKKIIELLETELSAAFEKAGYDKKYARVTVSNRPDLCQYQCNGALAAAKEYHKAPIQMAGEVVELLAESGTFQEIAAQMPHMKRLCHIRPAVIYHNRLFLGRNITAKALTRSHLINIIRQKRMADRHIDKSRHLYRRS